MPSLCYEGVVIDLLEDASGCSAEWMLSRRPSSFFHKTTLSGFNGILAARQITPNNGQFDPTFGQSDISYSRWLGGVSLLDFTTERDERIQKHADKYNLFGALPAQVFIEIDREALDQSQLLLPPDLSAKADPRLRGLRNAVLRMSMYVPAIEAIHIGPILAEHFVGYSLAGRSDDGQLLFQQFGQSEPEKVQECAHDWGMDDDQKRAARHSRGEYKLYESMKQPSPSRRRRTPEEIEALLRRFEEQYGTE